MTARNEPSSSAPRVPSLDFDGHLEWPLERMTPQQRLDWLTDMALLMLQARAARENDTSAAPDTRSRNE